MTRSDFSEPTKRIIAERSGYRCSFLGCDRSTVGPGAAFDQSSSIGVAAHIFAASSGGPRGSGGLTDMELTSAANGIWLCANHARAIDANQGDAYSSELLLSYKNLHEARIARDMQGITSPFGWYQEILVDSSPIFTAGTLCRFGKLSLVVGNNGTGKSALCEWIAGFCDVRRAERWMRGRAKGYPISVRLKYHNPDEKTLGMVIDGHGGVTYTEDGQIIPFNANPIKVLYPRSKWFSDTGDSDDLQLISCLLGIDEAVVLNLVEEVESYPQTKVKNLLFEKDEEGKTNLICDVDKMVREVRFGDLSSSERVLVLIELILAAARVYGRYIPTLLILDSPDMMDYQSWSDYLTTHFVDDSSLFQTIVVVPTGSLDVEKLKWFGWEIIRTEGSMPDVTIEQTIR